MAVLRALAKRYPEASVTFVCDASFAEQARGLMQQVELPVEVVVVSAGKFRRYAHMSRLRQLLTPSIALANLADIGKIVRGVWQSWRLLGRVRPVVVFAKGGFVCLPVGIAAHLRRIPLVIHDSDTRPGLTNRVLARWATAIATGSPLENYSYDSAISRYVGVPIGADFRPLSGEAQAAAKQRLGFAPDKPLVVATGGGLGSENINAAMLGAAEALLARGAQVYHVAGKAHGERVATQAPESQAYQVVGFVYEDMATVLGAADVVVARGSATFLQELAGLGKATIVIPARHLGDQLGNAAMYAKADAAVVLSDDEAAETGRLTQEIIGLLDDPARRQAYAEALHSFARPKAAEDVATMVTEAIEASRA